MIFTDPHIHLYSRTTDDYVRMYQAGLRAVVEPSFWLGSPRRYAGSYFDYFQHLLSFEPERARKFGISHFACVAMNPKEADQVEVAREVVAGLGPYLDHARCLAVGEIGFNRITPREEEIFQRQLELAKARNMLILVHSPHDTPEVSKRRGVERSIAILRELNYDHGRIIMDHNTEETMALTRQADLWAGLTVYPYSKLNQERVVDILKRWGTERTLVNSSADWGVSDPCNVANVARHMAAKGYAEGQVRGLLWENPASFYGQSGRFTPDYDLPFIDPGTYQR